MRTKRAIPVLFIVAAIYDGLLGAVFLFGSGVLFQWFGVTPPNHAGYVQFPAALLIVFAVMFVLGLVGVWFLYQVVPHEPPYGGRVPPVQQARPADATPGK